MRQPAAAWDKNICPGHLNTRECEEKHMDMQTGIKNEMSVVVTEDLTASKVGSGLLPVYATPSMIALMENTCASCVQPYLEEGQETIGTKVDIAHVSSTPIGMKVWCESELIDIDRRRLVFKVAAYDEKGLIGEGRHERFIIDIAKFKEKTESKLQ